jgi:hypothetical protein
VLAVAGCDLAAPRVGLAGDVPERAALVQHELVVERPGDDAACLLDAEAVGQRESCCVVGLARQVWLAPLGGFKRRHERIDHLLLRCDLETLTGAGRVSAKTSCFCS